jgi:hypothetical protein
MEDEPEQPALRAKLKHEGFVNVDEHMRGASIRKDLIKLLKPRP